MAQVNVKNLPAYPLPTINDYMIVEDYTDEENPVTSLSPISSMIRLAMAGFVTVGATGAEYTSIAAADAAGKFNMHVISDTTEPSDINFTVNGKRNIICNDAVTVTLGDYKFNIANAITANLSFSGGTVSFAYASAQDMIAYTGTGAGNIYFNRTNVINGSSVDGCHVNATPASSGYTQTFIGCRIVLPDFDGCGLQFSSGIGMDLTFVSGGSSCRGAISASRGQFSALKFEGASWSSGVVAQFGSSNVNGMLVTSESGTPSVRIWTIGASTLQGLYAEGSSGFNVIFLAPTSLTNFDTGTGTVFAAGGSGSSSVSNGKTVQALVSSNGMQMKFSNVRFTSSVGIEAVGSLFTGCTFDGNNQVRANNVQMLGVNAGVPEGVSGNTFTLVAGVKGCSIIGSNSEVPVVDDSGETTNTLVANNIWEDLPLPSVEESITTLMHMHGVSREEAELIIKSEK
jgi:hypothetical protein